LGEDYKARAYDTWRGGVASREGNDAKSHQEEGKSFFGREVGVLMFMPLL
jgi:hypothetical protein